MSFPNLSRRTLKWAAAALMAMMWPLAAQADCIGSGTSWSCSAGTSVAQVNAALGAASDGATLTFKAGSYSWSGYINFLNSKGASLVCESIRGCVVTPSGTVLGMNGTLKGTTDKLYRISGFKFQNGGTGPTIWFYGPGTMTRLMIDNNGFENYGSNPAYIYLGENSTVATFYGVVSKNTVTNSTNGILVHFFGAQQNAIPAQTAGSDKAMFIEDNTLNFGSMNNTGLGCVDGWGGNSVVWRYNTATNCRVVMHGVVHAGGPFLLEAYGNKFTCTNGLADCYRAIHHQGSGEFYAFNNSLTASSGKSSSAIELLHYRSATPSAAGYGSYQRCNGNSTNPVDGKGLYGYPCWRQPGRDGNGNLKPVYVWNNYWSDTRGRIDVSIANPWGASAPSVSDHIKEDRDVYNAVSASAQTSPTGPFTGASGMGFGTLANRPSTCTTNPNEAGGGVGYFAVDQGAQGTLYRCSATNTWVAHYTPFTYPHPLTTGNYVSSPAPAPLPAPLGLKVIN